MFSYFVTGRRFLRPAVTLPVSVFPLFAEETLVAAYSVCHVCFCFFWRAATAAVKAVIYWWKLACPLVDLYCAVQPPPPTPLLHQPLLGYSANSSHLIKGLVRLMVVSVHPPMLVATNNPDTWLWGMKKEGVGDGCALIQPYKQSDKQAHWLSRFFSGQTGSEFLSWVIKQTRRQCSQSRA